MTILHHDALLDAIKALPLKDRLVITPLLDQAQVGPSSIDLRLGTDFIELHRLERETLDPFSKTVETLVREERLVVPLGDDLILHPGQFILGATLEFLRMPDHLAGEVLNRSSWARMGLIVATAVFVQPGYSGVLTLELVNMGSVPMRLRPGLRIAQLVVSQLAGKPKHPYGAGPAKYVAPLGPERSKLDRESGEWRRLSRIGQALRGRSAAGDSPAGSS